ncbi:hypothetical protein [Bartonella sp. MU70NMGDW]|uniref:hypothetical protein n=1 Tax=Bartonella sp. MU70NMGDW TaxID=3243561 RepID=UPI0035CEBA24
MADTFADNFTFKIGKMFSVNRPIDVVVLNYWITEKKDTLCSSHRSINLAKSAKEWDKRSTLYNNDRINQAAFDVIHQAL